jgi:hypothetical protein
MRSVNLIKTSDGFNLFTGVQDLETAITLGYAFAIGSSIYKDKKINEKGISERIWALAIRAEVFGLDTAYKGLYKNVMEGFYD